VRKSPKNIYKNSKNAFMLTFRFGLLIENYHCKSFLSSNKEKQNLSNSLAHLSQPLKIYVDYLILILHYIFRLFLSFQQVQCSTLF